MEENAKAQQLLLKRSRRSHRKERSKLSIQYKNLQNKQQKPLQNKFLASGKTIVWVGIACFTCCYTHVEVREQFACASPSST